MRKKARVILHVSKVMFVERQQVGQGLCQVIVFLSIHPSIPGLPERSVDGAGRRSHLVALSRHCTTLGKTASVNCKYPPEKHFSLEVCT